MKNLTIRPINTGYVPTHPLQYHYHFSCAPYLKGVPSEKVPFLFPFLVEGRTSYYWWIRVWHGQKEQMIIIIPAHGKNLAWQFMSSLKVGLQT